MLKSFNKKKVLMRSGKKKKGRKISIHRMRQKRRRRAQLLAQRSKIIA
ncbi:hypothetical protein [Longitalea arenae]|nr:hypothetical protein [Longitalea arenae]